jgi:hypothetical protein
MSDTFAHQALKFFEDPAVDHPPPYEYSVLYLLRRDIAYCMGDDPSSVKALFPGVIGIFAGIDLLAKFCAGSDTSSVGRRFRRFVGQYFGPLSSRQQEILYQLRNALMHSFGLYAFDRQRKRTYRFELCDGSGPLLEPAADDWFRIHVRTLYEAFEEAVEAYRQDLQRDEALKAKFTAMFPRYGWIARGMTLHGDSPCLLSEAASAGEVEAGGKADGPAAR